MSVNSITLKIFDKIAASCHVAEMNETLNTLGQLPDLIRGGDGTASLAYGFGSDSAILLWLPAANATIAASVPNLLIAAQYKQLMGAAGKQASNQGFTSLDKYLTSLNEAVPYSGLVHPNFALIYYVVNNGQGTQMLSPSNVFAPLTQFGTAAVGPGAGTVVFQQVASIPTANTVSGVMFQSLQGYTAAPGVSATGTTAVNGTLQITLMASGQNAAGALVTNRTWTAALDNLPAGGIVVFAPSVAGDRITQVTGMTSAGTATAGAFTLNSVLERNVS